MRLFGVTKFAGKYFKTVWLKNIPVGEYNTNKYEFNGKESQDELDLTYITMEQEIMTPQLVVG